MRLWSGVHSPLSSPAPSEAPACDIQTPSCPPLSIHLHHSYPTPFLVPSLSLSPLTYLHLLSLPLCLSVPPTHFTLFLSKTLLSFSLSPFFPPLYNFTPYVSIPLVLCHSLSIPHLLFHPPLVSLCIIFPSLLWALLFSASPPH